MRLCIAIASLSLMVGCVTGPVKEGQGPVTTRNLQDMGEQEGAKLAAIATRNTLDNYKQKMANIWDIWKTGEKRIREDLPPGNLTAAQASESANQMATDLLAAAVVRDDALVTLDRKRAVELSDIMQLQKNQIAVVTGIVAGWAAQGEISSSQYASWLGVIQVGVSAYMEQQHIRTLRKEAEEAAKAAAESQPE